MPLAPRWILVLALALTLGCAGGEARRADPGERPDAGEPKPEDGGVALADPPYSAAQIRAATFDGRTYRFHLQGQGAQDVYSEMRFEAPTNHGARLVTTLTDASGAPLEPPSAEDVTWEELVAHASYPLIDTVVTDAEVDVPAGHFTCWLYTVATPLGDGPVIRAWFAKDMPGAPVRHEVRVEGAVVNLMELVSYEPGATQGDP